MVKSKKKHTGVPSAKRPENEVTDEEYIERTHELLTAAVTKRMNASDVPIGVLTFWWP